MSKFKLLTLAISSFLLAACSTTPPSYPQRKEALRFIPESIDRFKTSVDNAPAALEAFRASCTTLRRSPLWADRCRNAVNVASNDPDAAWSFFEKNFTPWRIEVVVSENDREVEVKTTGLMTGYYEPLLYGSRVKEKNFNTPLYGVPDDLIQVDLADVYPQLAGLRLRGKLDGRRLVPYDTRESIQKRSDMDAWAIAWVDDPVAAFFLHIQGSGRILLPDGSYMRVGFADQNGYRYRSIGNWLVANGHLKKHELSMQRIQAWAREHPELVNEALAQNPSYVFFEERTGDPNLGPLGAQGIPLTDMASVAIDRKYWPLGLPFAVAVDQDKPSLHFERFVVAQDVGSAIKGPIRFDYYWGFGDEAGRLAGRQYSRVQRWVLLPSGTTPETVIKVMK